MRQTAACGEGLAKNAVLPEKLSELMASMAEVLSQHLGTLELDDPGAKSEHAAYQQVIALQRRVSALSKALADDMRQFATLPPAAHDFGRLSTAEMTTTLRDLVRRKEELTTLLADQLQQDRAMLASSEP